MLQEFYRIIWNNLATSLTTITELLEVVKTLSKLVIIITTWDRRKKMLMAIVNRLATRYEVYTWTVRNI